MGIEFAPMLDLDAYRLTLLQGEWRAHYPQIQNVPGMQPSELVEVGAPAFSVHTGQPPTRIWAQSADASRLVQTQADRLILNWRTQGADTPYPGFEDLRAEYAQLWRDFNAFLEKEGIESPRLRLGEFTYVNAVDVGPAEALSDVVTFTRQPGALPGAETLARFQFARRVEKSEEHPYSAQIVVTAEPQMTDVGRQVVLQVSTRTLFEDSPVDPLAAIDAAHALSSFAFTGIVAEEKQASWGRLS